MRSSEADHPAGGPCVPCSAVHPEVREVREAQADPAVREAQAVHPAAPSAEAARGGWGAWPQREQAAEEEPRPVASGEATSARFDASARDHRSPEAAEAVRHRARAPAGRPAGPSSAADRLAGPSSAAGRPGGPSSAGVRPAVRPSWAEAESGHRCPSSAADHRGCRASAAAAAYRLDHQDSLAAAADPRWGSAAETASAAARPGSPAASADPSPSPVLPLEPPSAAASSSSQGLARCPSGPSPALRRDVPRPGTACAGCSSAAARTASSTR